MTAVRSASGKDRRGLFLALFVSVLMLASFVALSLRDPDGAWLRTGMLFMTLGFATWFGWRLLLPLTFAIWLAPTVLRAMSTDWSVLEGWNVVELPALLALALAALAVREHLRPAEQAPPLQRDELDAESGVFQEAFLKAAISSELARSRRFNRTFALVLVGVDELHQRFDYRDEEWAPSFRATASLLGRTRNQVDRVYRYGERSFAMLLPESGPKDVMGLVKRLARDGRKAKPPAGKPGGPLPLHFGATFFPECATAEDDLLKRAEIALKVAAKAPDRLRLDGAEAPSLPPPETLRAPEEDDVRTFAEEVAPSAAPTPMASAAKTINAIEESTEPSAPAFSGWEVPVENRRLAFELGPMTRRPHLVVVPALEDRPDTPEAPPVYANGSTSTPAVEADATAVVDGISAEEMARLLDLLGDLDSHLGATLKLIRDLRQEQNEANAPA